jgi:hypothetical protein
LQSAEEAEEEEKEHEEKVRHFVGIPVVAA